MLKNPARERQGLPDGGRYPLITAPRRSGWHGRSCGNTPTGAGVGDDQGLDRQRHAAAERHPSPALAGAFTEIRILLLRTIRVSRTHPLWARLWRTVCVASNGFYPAVEKNPLFSSLPTFLWAGVSAKGASDTPRPGTQIKQAFRRDQLPPSGFCAALRRVCPKDACSGPRTIVNGKLLLLPRRSSPDELRSIRRG